MFKRTKVCSALMVAFGGSLTLSSALTFAQQQLERVEITGSSIKRIDAETALPVQIITRGDIERSGVINVEQLLMSVSAVSSSGGLTASSVSGATTGGISAVSLHGLTSIRTLVLINGRRIAPYGIGFTGDSVSVDVNSIPLAAVERVEVLKDGASAIYGSDAIAGVINFILRKDFTGVELSATYGDSTQGGARVQRASGAYGFGDLTKDRFNVMVVGSVQKESALFGRDRGFASSGINVGNLNDTTSGNTFPANIFIPDLVVNPDFDPTDPDSKPRLGASRNPSAATGCQLPYSQIDPLFGSRACRFDPSPLVQLVPDSERASIFASAKFAITNDLEAYVEASYNRNKQNNVIQPVPLSDQFALPPSHPLFNVAPYNGFSTFLLRPSSPFYPTTYVQDQYTANGLPGTPLPDLLVRYRSAVTGDRDITDISEAPRLALGVKGAFAGWDFDTGFLHSQSKVREQVNSGFPSQSQILPILNSGIVNPFGPNSATVDAQLRATNFVGDAFKIKSTIDSLQGKVSRELVTLPAGALAVAAGAEYRKEKYLFDANPTIQTGDISGYGGNFLNTDKNRQVGAVFGEVVVPIVKGLEANAAIRWDKYEGVGNSTTPKVSLRWQPTKSFILRGSYGEGFRAPSLQDLYLPQTTGVTVPGLSDPLRCPTTKDGIRDCTTQFPIVNGGNTALKPEKSKNTTVGIVFEPTTNSSLTIDWFKVNLKDNIANGITPTTIILNNQTAYGSLITRGQVDPAFPTLPGPITSISQTNINIGSVFVSGVDVDARFAFPAEDYGKFVLGLVGTYFNRYDTENPDGTISPGVGEVNGATGGLIPRWKHRLSVDWTLGPWSATLAQNWQSPYNDLLATFIENPNANGEPLYQRRVKSYQTWDLNTTFSGFKDFKISVGVRNLFNTDPPYTNAGGQTSFQGGYDPQYGDPRGRFIYGTVTYAFK